MSAVAYLAVFELRLVLIDELNVILLNFISDCSPPGQNLAAIDFVCLRDKEIQTKSADSLVAPLQY